jgi:hypothetical protein
VTRLCGAAYKYLSQFGIRYLLIVLDELETAAEAATFGLEREDLTYLDGRAIKLLGKAIKEEDPRRKLPWLRYVALCSPAIGDEFAGATVYGAPVRIGGSDTKQLRRRQRFR